MADYGDTFWAAWECSSGEVTQANPYGLSRFMLGKDGKTPTYDGMLRAQIEAYGQGVRRFVAHRPCGEVNANSSDMTYEARLRIMADSSRGDPIRKLASGHAINAYLRAFEREMPGARLIPYLGTPFGASTKRAIDEAEPSEGCELLLESARPWIDSPIVDMAFDATMPDAGTGSQPATDFESVEWTWIAHTQAWMKSKGRRFYGEPWPRDPKWWEKMPRAICIEWFANRWRKAFEGADEAVCWLTAGDLDDKDPSGKPTRFYDDQVGWLAWCFANGVTPCVSWWLMTTKVRGVESIETKYGGLEQFIELGRKLAADNAGKVENEEA